ncbi:MAG: PRC-barrel domain-containing protein [Methylibium sp.]|uniref:PRC-barrel domain-containing protein n=1 Tax=Methylibium sp. TaxID=2067992 RepID=UPI0018323914|nr:PRC-barrel domain-containing protein [Methylibium sp.]MBA3595890.1 PRC-barrel domain-containing protein [Methylibium sp.]
MLFSTRQLEGFKLDARDGEIGRVREVYFDDRHWVIRHLVVDTGGWLSGRKVLISPHSIERLDRDQQRLTVALSRQQIEDAPGIDADKPVSRQHEIAFSDHYGYPYYWTGTGLWGAAAYPLTVGAMAVPQAEDGRARELSQRAAQAEDAAADPNLRSSKEVIGYHIEAGDGSIGHIEDFLFDERSWQIRQAVVDTRNWLPGRLVLVSPEAIESVDWSARQVRVKLTREAVKASPPYDRNAPLSGEGESALQARHERS